jgi:hypothetical protein
LRSKWPASRSRKRHITSAVKLSVKTMKCIRPLVPIADIAFTENRFPLRRTTGVLPLAPQVRPVTWSERMPTWSAKGISPPSFLALARIVGQVSSCHRPTASGSCSTARLSGHRNDRPHRLRYLPTPGSVSRTRYSFAISSPTSRRVHNCPPSPTSQGR